MTRFVSVALIAGLSMATIGSAAAAQCIRAGGWGTGVMESFASFMSTAAMKNQAKLHVFRDFVIAKARSWSY